MTRPTLDEIRAAAKAYTLRKDISRVLREQGFKFPSKWLWTRLDWIKEQAIEAVAMELDAPQAPGVIESADKHREWARGKTFVLTSAQSNTRVHRAFLRSLEHLCHHRDAELHIAQYTYNKAKHGKLSIKPGSKADTAPLWFDPEITPYISNTSLQLAPDLVWCGELNVLPTMKFPLTQFKTYTRQHSAIVPHAKMAMESVPVMPGIPAKMLYTTGAVTQRNYIQKTAGQVADFHHVFGAMLVEVDDDGTWWARQINAKNDGTFYDLTNYYTPDGVEEGQPVAAMTHGDIHWGQRDKDVLLAVFKNEGIVDALQPQEQFFHDVIDFTARNHHEIKDGHYWHKMLVAGQEKVEDEFLQLSRWFDLIDRPWSNMFVITSNHDQFMEHWLRDISALKDPTNVSYWHFLNWYCHQTIHRGVEPRPFAYALLSKVNPKILPRFKILHEDESHMICGSIEAGLHGHLGPNGARGNPKNLRTVGKANTAHTHSAGIVEGVYTCGVYGTLRMSYTKGLSSWSHSLIVTYANAKRAILTIKNGKAWR